MLLLIRSKETQIDCQLLVNMQKIYLDKKIQNSYIFNFQQDTNKKVIV